MITLRRAGKNEIALLAQIGSKSYKKHFCMLWNNKNELNDFIQQQFSPEAIGASIKESGTEWFTVSDENNIVVGLCQTEWRRNNEAASGHGACLKKLYFLPQYTGKKYGEQTLHAIEKLYRKKKIDYYWLEVLAGNNGARRFYQRNGFFNIAEKTFNTAAQKSRLYILQKNL